MFIYADVLHLFMIAVLALIESAANNIYFILGIIHRVPLKKWKKSIPANTKSSRYIFILT